MVGVTNEGIGAPEYCCGGKDWEFVERFTFGRDCCISGNVGSSRAPEETPFFRGVC